jgi:hypothetical protein
LRAGVLEKVGLIGLHAHGKEEWDGIKQSTYDLKKALLRGWIPTQWEAMT